MTAQQVYDQAVKPLTVAERLQLAALILNDLPPQALVDYSEEWTDEDIADFQRATWDHIDRELDSISVSYLSGDGPLERCSENRAAE